MIIWMKPGEPPHRGDVVQRERILIAALEDIQSGIAVPLVIQLQPDATVCRLHYLAIIRAVDRADQVQLVGGVRVNRNQALG